MNSASKSQRLRVEVASWMSSHLSGEFACLKYRGGPGDEEAYPALRKQWERELASGGWTGSVGRHSTAAARCRWPNR